MRLFTQTINKAAQRRPNAGHLLVIGAMAASAVLLLAQAAQAGSGPQISALAWHLQDPPVPSGSIGSGFSDVSCASPDACTAVGSYESSGSVFTTFAENWNGSSWTIRSVPEATSSNLNGVTCLSATDCVAVGDVLTGVGIDTATLAEVWNGSSWTVQSTPTPKHGTRSFLIDVSCTSATQCTAVGFYTNKSGSFLLAERWNGASWKIQGVPQPGGTTMSEFTGVSCASASACTAVGSDSTNMLAEAWNGTSWTLQSTPDPSGGSESSLGGVSCTTAAACTATGDYFNGSDQVSLAERWNGAHWTAQSTPNRVGAMDTDLAGVSCASAGRCVAVGSVVYHSGPGRPHTQAENWNGSAWSLKNPGQPDGALSSALVSVSCPTTAYCIAVGYWVNSSDTDIILADQYS